MVPALYAGHVKVHANTGSVRRVTSFRRSFAGTLEVRFNGTTLLITILVCRSFVKLMRFVPGPPAPPMNVQTTGTPGMIWSPSSRFQCWMDFHVACMQCGHHAQWEQVGETVLAYLGSLLFTGRLWPLSEISSSRKASSSFSSSGLTGTLSLGSCLEFNCFASWNLSSTLSAH